MPVSLMRLMQWLHGLLFDSFVFPLLSRMTMSVVPMSGVAAFAIAWLSAWWYGLL